LWSRRSGSLKLETWDEVWTQGCYADDSLRTAKARHKLDWFERIGALDEKPQRVLDVGCGAGYVLEGIRRRLGEGVELTGIDVSGVAVSKAKLRLGPSVSLIHADASRMDGLLQGKRFELVIMFCVVEHLTRQSRLEPLLAARRVLAQGGGLLFVTSNTLSVFRIEHAVRALAGRWTFGYTKEETFAGATEMLNSAGFAVKESTVLPCDNRRWLSRVDRLTHAILPIVGRYALFYATGDPAWPSA